MPLTINTKNCVDYHELKVWREENKAAWQPEGYYFLPKVEALGFALGMLGCGDRVTESNAGEIARRLALYEAAEGALCRDGDGEPDPFTKADVERLVGLSTNWGFKRESRARWMNRVLARDEVSV